ncbi:MAG: flagellar hook-basal body complex protein [Tardiphaga sp.]|uniref:flagellar hook-basal body complex protein n=1 Tax=Tardiphaga sp. TaxID=1926292 RepID=UPI0019AF7705|nr:flagellar hook-basal body complex protein [Tardiphaga sp.]MBC7583234.1 flagellar hook-basal body complex protein [Tardiphaga sp.]
MDVSSYVLLSHEQALRRRLDITANNMANSSTAGFKREQPVFHDYVENGTGGVVEGADRTAYVLDYGATHNTAAGTFTPTSNPLDVMIEGPGYLSVEAPDGGVAYTRAGYLKVSASGDLVTANGQRLLGEGGQPINIPPEEQAGVTIGADGSVIGKQGALGRMTVTVFDEATVTPRGDGLMTGDNGRILGAAETKIKMGGIEASNIQPIGETTAMVDILRAYQSSQAISQSINDMRSRAIDRLSRSN